MKKLTVAVLVALAVLVTASIASADGSVVSTLAGSGVPGFADGPGATAQFRNPVGVAVDAAGNVYVADHSNSRIRKVSPAGVVSTLAGSGLYGFSDGPGATAQFGGPTGVAVDAAGNVYVADLGNQRIRKVSPAGVVSTLAGSGVSGFADGPGATAQFNLPLGVAVDSAGNVYVADGINQRIRKVSPAGVVSTLAGSGVFGFADGPGATAQFWGPTGVAVDSAGNVYVAEGGNQRIRKVSPVFADITPPVITSVSVDPNEVWPPNNKMVSVSVTVVATDDSGDAPTCTITGVTGDEIIDGDWETTGDLTLDIRAERDGGGDGRVYTISVTCSDEAGNRADGSVDVTVAHDPGKGKG